MAKDQEEGKIKGTVEGKRGKGETVKEETLYAKNCSDDRTRFLLL